MHTQTYTARVTVVIRQTTTATEATAVAPTTYKRELGNFGCLHSMKLVSLSLLVPHLAGIRWTPRMYQRHI